VEVYVDADDLPLVLGTQIDFAVEGLNATLKFKNPNADSYCGCGESFSVKPI
jgi:iron-sulfur cluster assembly accessory protein